MLWLCCLQLDLGSALTFENIDNGMGVLFPFWDEGTKMVYIVGKVKCGNSTLHICTHVHTHTTHAQHAALVSSLLLHF